MQPCLSTEVSVCVHVKGFFSFIFIMVHCDEYSLKGFSEMTEAVGRARQTGRKKECLVDRSNCFNMRGGV